MNFFEVLKAKDIETVPEDFYTKIDIWNSWYKGKVDAFHRYRIFTGQTYVNCERYSMGMGKKVSEDWANLLMNEKVHITLEGDKEQEFFNNVCEANNFEVKMNEMQEYKAALGTVAYIPHVNGVEVDLENGRILGQGNEMKIDYCTADKIFPISWDNGIITECAFATKVVANDSKYYYLQIHRKNENGTYRIESSLFDANQEILTEVSLDTIPEYAKVPEVIETGITERQFVIDRMNIANNIDKTLPLGISVYANAIDQLKAVDIAYDSYVNEFVLGKKRIMVKAEATKDFDGEPLFDVNDVAFYIMPEDSQTGSMIQEINMELRSAQHNAGIQDMLNILSSKCGFGESHYKYERGNISTATQIISENSTLFRNIKKQEIILESCLKELVKIILRLGNQFMNAGLNEDVEISIDFDDSIIEDKATEFARDVQMVGMGILQPYEFRMKWMNEDEDTAKAALPMMEQLINGESDVE